MTLEEKIEKARKLVTLGLLNKIFTYGPHTFTYTEDNRQEVNRKMKKALKKKPTVIITYPRYKRSKMVAYTDESHNIYINGYKDHSVCSLVGSIVHELSHVAGYRHGGNWITFWNRKRKMKSVPYKNGKVAKRICEWGL